MADAVLSPRSPLEGLALPTGPRFTLSEAPPAARFILRGSEAVRVSCGMAFGADLPAQLGPAGEGAGRAALWLGPDEWLLIADGADAADVGGVLELVLEGTAHSLVDVSHRQIGLIASGPAAARVLNAGCPLDLDLKAFRSASRRAPCSTKWRSCSGDAPRRHSMSKSGDRSRPILRPRSPRPRAARRTGEGSDGPSDFGRRRHRTRRALAKLLNGDLGHFGRRNATRRIAAHGLKRLGDPAR